MRRFANEVEKIVDARFASGDGDDDETAKNEFYKIFAAKVNPDVLHHVALNNGVAKKIAGEVVNETEKHWTPSKGAAIKARCKLSWTRYQRMMQITCQEFDDESGKYCASCIGEGYLDVRFPQMSHNASKNKV